MKKLIVLCDLDDVLWVLMPYWVNELNLKHGLSLCEKDITEWNMVNFYPTLTKSEVFAPIVQKGFWEKVEPALYGEWFVNKILSDGHVLKIVTASFYQNLSTKMDRLFKVYPKIKWKDVVITSDKQLIKWDVLIDDRADNLIGGDYHKILINKPHNHKVDAESYEIVRVCNLKEAYSEINKLINREETA